MDIVTEKVVSDLEAKELLEKREKKGELKYEQKNALEILRKFVKSEPERIKTVLKELESIETLRDKHVVAIANFLPEDKNDLRAILHKEYSNFSEEEIEKIIEIVKKG